MSISFLIVFLVILIRRDQLGACKETAGAELVR